MSDSVRPHRRQPTRLPCPWDSPGKDTGVGCHFLLQCMKVESEVAQSCPTFSDPMDCSLPGSSIHGFSRQEYWSGMPFPNKAQAIPSQIMSLLCFCLFSLSLFSSSCWWKVKMKVAQSCVTLWDPIDCSPPGSSAHGILQARILGWLFPSPGDLLNPGIEPRSPALQVDSLPSEPLGKQVQQVKQ